jgi:CRP/FNR family transcriptional regulator
MFQTMPLAVRPIARPGHASRQDCFASIEALGSNLSAKRDQTIFREGDPATHCYKVTSGAVRICRLTPDGRRHVTDFFLPGDTINFEFAGLHSCTAEAIIDSVVRRYPARAIDRLVAETPKAACQMLALASARLQSAEQQMVTLGRKTATERLASFLVMQFARRADDGAASENLTLPMARADIADHLGLTIETVSRVFAKFKRDKIIDLPSAQCIIVRDWPALAERC